MSERSISALDGGLYLTTSPLPGYEDEIGAGQLVKLDLRQPQGEPALRLPHPGLADRAFWIRQLEELEARVDG